MYNFDYHRPKNVADAVAALKKASDGKLIAGGQTLLPTLKHAFGAAVRSDRSVGRRRAARHQGRGQDASLSAP